MAKRNDHIYYGEQAGLFCQGEESALEFFFTEFYGPLTYFAARYIKHLQVAEEIASGAFVKAWKHRGRLDSFEGIRAYLYKIVVRDCRRYLRNIPRDHKLPVTINGVDGSEADLRAELIRAETARLLRDTVKKLAPGYRKVITMHFLEGRSTGEIAELLNVPVNTIKAQKLKGLRALRKLAFRLFA